MFSLKYSLPDTNTGARLGQAMEGTLSAARPLAVGVGVRETAAHRLPDGEGGRPMVPSTSTRKARETRLVRQRE